MESSRKKILDLRGPGPRYYLEKGGEFVLYRKRQGELIPVKTVTTEDEAKTWVE